VQLHGDLATIRWWPSPGALGKPALLQSSGVPQIRVDGQKWLDRFGGKVLDKS